MSTKAKKLSAHVFRPDGITFTKPNEYYRIVLDPDKENGLSIDGLIKCVRQTLDLGHFTPGTILEQKGKRYQVEGELETTQKLRLI